MNSIVRIPMLKNRCSDAYQLVGFSGETIFETSEGVEILVALIAEALEGWIPSDADFVAPGRIFAVGTFVAELRCHTSHHCGNNRL